MATDPRDEMPSVDELESMLFHLVQQTLHGIPGSETRTRMVELWERAEQNTCTECKRPIDHHAHVFLGYTSLMDFVKDKDRIVPKETMTDLIDFYGRYLSAHLNDMTAAITEESDWLQIDDITTEYIPLLFAVLLMDALAILFDENYDDEVEVD